MNAINKVVVQIVAAYKKFALTRSADQAYKHIKNTLAMMPDGSSASVALNGVSIVLGCGDDGLVWGALPQYAVSIEHGRHITQRNKAGDRIVCGAYLA